jgi:hypothetical protein
MKEGLADIVDMSEIENLIAQGHQQFPVRLHAVPQEAQELLTRIAGTIAVEQRKGDGSDARCVRVIGQAMVGIGSATQFHLAPESSDMRMSFNGLHALEHTGRGAIR